MRGTFIVLDGGEGAGKSTVIQRLKEHYGDAIMTTHEPGGCARAEAIRKLILSEEGKSFSPEEQHRLFWEARHHHMQERIIPALREGKIVISDRFDSSTWAYQIGAFNGRNLAPEFWELRARVLGTYVPDHYLIFTVSAETSMERTKSRGAQTHFDKQGHDFHTNVLRGMLEFTSLPNIPASLIDAELSPEEVYQQSHVALRPFLEK